MYKVVAYERGIVVCEAALSGVGFNCVEAVYLARDLRDEYPDAIVVILPEE